MSDSNTTTVVTGTASAVAGAATLPNTGNNTLLTVFSIVAISLGVVVLGSFAASRLAAKLLR
mgnify:CR=1 FL=1